MEKEMATHSNILAWRIPWTEEPGVKWETGRTAVLHAPVTARPGPWLQEGRHPGPRRLVGRGPCREHP